jgi:hypothetical protein
MRAIFPYFKAKNVTMLSWSPYWIARNIMAGEEKSGMGVTSEATPLLSGNTKTH